ncbi:MAG TPA: hypothetical protein VFU13_02125 [Steroidobacteraceae bacterium]|nr:hypothetical protein [Steroidobacteraceae bacterium]
MAVDVARPADAVAGEERAVLQAIAALVNVEATRQYERLYFETQFEGAPHVTSSLTNADRTSFCGLPREDALALVGKLQKLTARRVALDKEMAKSAGLKLGEKKNPRFPYVILSRAIFEPGNQFAWVAVELNGSTGAILRLDKVAGEWKKTDRCGGWLKAEE